MYSKLCQYSQLCFGREEQVNCALSLYLSEGSQRHVYPGRHSYILQVTLPVPLGQGIVGTSVDLSLPDCADKPRYLERGPSLGTFSILS